MSRRAIEVWNPCVTKWPLGFTELLMELKVHILSSFHVVSCVWLLTAAGTGDTKSQFNLGMFAAGARASLQTS